MTSTETKCCSRVKTQKNPAALFMEVWMTHQLETWNLGQCIQQSVTIQLSILGPEK